MCLVFIGFEIDDRYPVMIGANREESRSRPTTSPVCCRSQSLRCLLAGADHGPDGSFPEMGTWLGVNEAGLAVAVTNRSDGELAWADQTRSRGLLAVALLEFATPGPAVRLARSELARGGYGGSNFLIAHADAAFVVQAPGRGSISTLLLDPGIHAMTNLDIGDEHDSRIDFVLENVKPGEFVDSAWRVCRDGRIIIPGPERGTISSSVMLVGREITLDHIRGDPRGREYERFRLLEGYGH